MLWKHRLFCESQRVCTTDRENNRDKQRHKNLQNKHENFLEQRQVWYTKVNHKFAIKKKMLRSGIKITRHAQFLKSCCNKSAYLGMCVCVGECICMNGCLHLKLMNHFPWNITADLALQVGSVIDFPVTGSNLPNFSKSHHSSPWLVKIQKQFVKYVQLIMG